MCIASEATWGVESDDRMNGRSDSFDDGCDRRTARSQEKGKIPGHTEPRRRLATKSFSRTRRKPETTLLNLPQEELEEKTVPKPNQHTLQAHPSRHTHPPQPPIPHRLLTPLHSKPNQSPPQSPHINRNRPRQNRTHPTPLRNNHRRPRHKSLPSLRMLSFEVYKIAFDHSALL